MIKRGIYLIGEKGLINSDTGLAEIAISESQRIDESLFEGDMLLLVKDYKELFNNYKGLLNDNMDAKT